MSYNIVKNIKINSKEQKVIMDIASSNLFPITFEKYEANFKDTFQSGGKPAVEKAILENFLSGNYHGKTTYAKAVKLFKEKYADGLEYVFRPETEEDKQKTKEYLDKLYEFYIKFKSTQNKCIVDFAQGYLKRVNQKSLSLTLSEEKAKVFKNRFHAEFALLHYQHVDFKILPLAEVMEV
jgi:hypothetical protein